MKRFALSVGVLVLLASAGRADEVEMDGLKSKAPDSWKKGKPANTMQHTVFTLPKADGDADDATLTVYFFGPGGGGGAQANITRWKGMFKAPAGEKAKVEKSKVSGVDVTTVDLAGTYLFKARPFDPMDKPVEKPDFRMLGVIFASKNGPYYMRLVGPAKTVEKHKKEFDGWLKAFK